MFISSSASNGLEFWSLNHASIYEKKLKVFKNSWVKYLIIDQMITGSNSLLFFPMVLAFSRKVIHE